MWSEGLPLNPGFGTSDVGLDVVMREHYSATIPNWNAPHWTQPKPLMAGPTSELEQRYFPMQLAALWDMPQSPDGFSNFGAIKFKAFMYSNLIAEAKSSVNVFAFDDHSADEWSRSEGLYSFASETRELQASLLSDWETLNFSHSMKPTVKSTTTPACVKWPGAPSNPRKPWQGQVNCGVYARGFRESSSFFCVHVVAVNPDQYPAVVQFDVDGLGDATAEDLAAPCLHAGVPGEPAPVPCALRLFDQVYALKLTSIDSRGGVMTFSDTLAGYASAVYRIGCNIPPLPKPAEAGPSIVYDGSFEGVDHAVPEKFVQRVDEPVGRSLYPQVGGTNTWHILHGEPPLPPILNVQHDDLRAQMRPDTTAPFHGRHALRLMLPTADVPAILPVPLQQAHYGVEDTLMQWTLLLRMRASPAVANLLVVSGGCYIGGGVKNASGWFGLYYVACPQLHNQSRPNAVVGEVWGNVSVAGGRGWQEFEFRIKNQTMWSRNLWLNFSTAARLGTRVWLDAVTLTNNSICDTC
jgi:hypothetical protein